MKRAMTAYGEIVFLDSTYKLLNLDLTLMLFLVEDSSTHSEIVGVSLLLQEDRESFEWLNKVFKSVHGKSCDKIQCLMADKDLLERDVLKTVFPGIPIYICRYHALKSISRGFTNFKCKCKCKCTMPKALRTDCLIVLEKMVYCKSQAAYDDLYLKLRDIAPDCAFQYFDTNWHNIQDEWSAFQMNCGNLGNYTNNRLESINKHIKTVVKKRSSLVDFLEKFFIWIQSHNHENDSKTAKALLKRSVVVMSFISDDEKQFMSILMPEPFEKIKFEMKQMKSVQLMKRSSEIEKQECLLK